MRPPAALVEFWELEGDRQKNEKVIMDAMPAFAVLAFFLDFGNPDITERNAQTGAPRTDTIQGVGNMPWFPRHATRIGQGDKPRPETEAAPLHILLM